MKRILEKKEFPQHLQEMATSCHPGDHGGKYPMWIRVEYTNGEHNPPHAHLYTPDKKPSSQSLITKFLITENPPQKIQDIQIMKEKPPIPKDYAELIIKWAEDVRRGHTTNWEGLWIDWDGLEKTFK
jgi:hypothetical protein